MSDHDGENESPSDDPCPPRRCCSFAVTGRNPAYQAIYVCRSCSTRRRAGSKQRSNDQEEKQPAASANDGEEVSEAQLDCLCQACANICHGDHYGLEYVGFGPAYCDCHDMTLLDHDRAADDGDIPPVCQLVQSSNEESMRLNAHLQRGLSSNSRSLGSGTKSSCAYRMEAFMITEIVEDPDLDLRLRQSACELVKHSKETFWVEPGSDGGAAELCDLERLAIAVFQQHSAVTSSAQNHFCGAEWWVQVKYPAASGTVASQNALDSEAVDLHYDKDEAVSELFGLGVFPDLSTVTYLSGRTDWSDLPPHQDSAALPPQNMPQAPTLVVSMRYEENHREGEAVDVLISHPRRGKHLLFDGTLLHGAPAHLALREASTVECSHPNVRALTGGCEPRVTFLVNLWSNHKPVGVATLPSDVRRDLMEASLRSSGERQSCTDLHLTFQRLPVEEIILSSADDFVSEEPLYLPFVSRHATWGSAEDDDDDEEELDLSMLVPRHIKSSTFHTIRFHFDAQYSPILVQKYGPDDQYECEGQEASQMNVTNTNLPT